MNTTKTVAPYPIRLRPAPLTRSAFAPFGDVIETAGRPHTTINDGYAERYDNLARIDTTEQEGRTRLSIFDAKPRDLPFQIAMIERHPLSSQAFIPLMGLPFLIVVARAGEAPQPSDLHAFFVSGRQGINYARGTWHHPLIALERSCEFLVIDRGGPGQDYDEIFFDERTVRMEAP